MDFTANYFPEWCSWILLVVSAVFVIVTAYSLRHSERIQQPHLDRWLWCVFFLTVIWFLRVTLNNGLNMHLFGGMLMALLFGWRLGFLGLVSVNIMICLISDGLLINLGFAILLNALLPVTIAYFIFLLLEARLPRHFFIYIYGSAFFGSWISNAISGVAIAICLGIFGVFTWSYLQQEFLPYFFLFGFSEAFLTSGLMTLLVVYRPDWVYSFRDNRYLDDKPTD